MTTDVASPRTDTLYVEAASTRFAYRRRGPRGGVPLVLMHRFRGTIDWWDPEFLDRLTAERDVIWFDNIGIGYTAGEAMNSVEAFAAGAIEFIEALGLSEVDLLGWSFGGVVAQALTLTRPELVRRVVIAGSASGVAPGMPVMGERVVTIMGKADPSIEDTLYLFYPETEAARASGVDHLRKVGATTPAGAPQVSDAAATGQLEAIMAALGAPWETVVARLHTITQPVLYANGSHDVMIDAYASYAAVQELPNAKLVLYSDAGHAFLFQHLDDFTREVTSFLAD